MYNSTLMTVKKKKKSVGFKDVENNVSVYVMKKKIIYVYIFIYIFLAFNILYCTKKKKMYFIFYLI